MDFFALTEHNHAKGIKPKGRDGDPIGIDHLLYNGNQSNSLINTAKRFTADGRFVALYGQEFSTISSGNHSNVFDVGDVITAENGRFDQLVNDWLPSHLDSAEQPAILQFNHPCKKLRKVEYGHDDFGSETQWISSMGHHARLIEILNGPGLSKEIGRQPEVFEGDFKYYLTLGFHLAPTGDQDNHYKTWGTLTDTRTGVIAKVLTKSNILEAMRARHVYATEDKNLRVIFYITYSGFSPGQKPLLCGDIVDHPPENGTELSITYTIKDDDEPNADYVIDAFSGEIGEEDLPTVLLEKKQSGNTPTDHPGGISGVKYSGGRQFFYFLVHQMNEDNEEDRLWTAPLWFDNGSPNHLIQPQVDESQYVASKRSKIYHPDPACRDAQGIAPKNLIQGHDATIDRTPHSACPR
jgi:hypothetical protein